MTIPATPGGSPPTTTSSTPVWSTTAPPDVTIPAPPIGFVPVNFANYRSSHPIAGQAACVPDAAAEIEASSTYVTTFGTSVPQAKTLAWELVNAANWTALRTAAESFLLYARSLEVITWKSARADLEKLDAVFQAIASQDPAAVAAFPATQRLLDIPRVIAARAVATRARKAKATQASKANQTATTNPTTTPVVTAATPIVASTPPNVATAPAIALGTTAGGTAAH